MIRDGDVQVALWKLDKYAVLSAVFVAIAVFFLFNESIEVMVRYWYGHEEFGHAFLIPVLTLFFIWQKNPELEQIKFNGSWLGLVIVLLGLILFYIGSFGAVYVLEQYAFVTVVIGLYISFVGLKVTKLLLVPILLLYFMVPLPGFLYNNLSGQLQLISSQIGVYIIRLFDISVYLEGNVIDLGVYKLQVVEACSGLRYLFPLMTLGLIVAYMYKASALKKVIVFLSTIPITILMNSFRIGIIGVLVEYWGISMAEGFLHDFEGWVVFMGCIVILVIEMWVLNYFTSNRKAFSEVFSLDIPAYRTDELDEIPRKIPLQYYAGMIAIVIALIVMMTIPERNENIPNRKSFKDFPMVLDNWVGTKEKLDLSIIDALNFDDYLMANYIDTSTNKAINLYIGYYSTQRAEKVPHSPKACIPGGGWGIMQSDELHLPKINIGNKSLQTNRLVINRGEVKQVVYYWFQQRNRIISNEYLVKLYLLVDSILLQRSDGALIRLTSVLSPGESVEDGEMRLKNFSRKLGDIVTDYVPE